MAVCPICTEPFTEEDPAVEAHPTEGEQRSHIYHKQCLVKAWWYERGSNYFQCPECRVRCPREMELIQAEVFPNCIMCHQPLTPVTTTPHNEGVGDCHHEGHVSCWENLCNQDGPVLCPVCRDDVSEMRVRLNDNDDDDDDNVEYEVRTERILVLDAAMSIYSRLVGPIAPDNQIMQVVSDTRAFCERLRWMLTEIDTHITPP